MKENHFIILMITRAKARRREFMNIILTNLEEAKEYINEKKGYVIAELMYARLMKEPEEIRIKAYEMLTQKDNTEKTVFKKYEDFSRSSHETEV